MNYFYILVFCGLGAGMVGGGLIISYLIAPHRPNEIKNTPYECGEQPIGDAWIQYNVGYYLFGLLFLVFDVEAGFLYPWAVVFREVGSVALFEMGIFLLVLIVGLIYAWRKGALEWL